MTLQSRLCVNLKCVMLRDVRDVRDVHDVDTAVIFIRWKWKYKKLIIEVPILLLRLIGEAMWHTQLYRPNTWFSRRIWHAWSATLCMFRQHTCMIAAIGQNGGLEGGQHWSLWIWARCSCCVQCIGEESVVSTNANDIHHSLFTEKFNCLGVLLIWHTFRL